MTNRYSIEKRNKIRQVARKASYDKKVVHEVLDAGLVAHVGLENDGGPVVVPMIYGRDGETLLLHGARKARVIRLLERAGRACVNVTIADGLVLARSAFNSSMHYRSVTVFGVPRLVEDPDEKLAAMHAISEHLMPGRWQELRAPHENEVKMTGVVALPIDSASAKISAGPPDDEDEDYDLPVWAGVLPITQETGELVGDDRVPQGVSASPAMRALERRRL